MHPDDSAPLSFSRRDALRHLAVLATGAALLPLAGATLVEVGQGGLPRTTEPTGNPNIDKALGLFESSPLVVTKLRSGLALLSGHGGNIAAVAGPDGALLVDTGVHPAASKVAKAARAFAGKPVTTVVNTHWHFDHTGGNELFGRHGARLIAHDNTRSRMAHDQPIEAFGYVVPASPAIALPTLTFPDSLTLRFGAETLRLYHVEPAHTDGDVLVHFPDANVLHTGDIFFNGVYPAIDYSTGGWIGGMVAAEDRALALCDGQTRLIPGHGPLATPADLRAAREMLATVQARLERLLDAGRSVDDVVAAAPTHDLDERWGKGLFDGPSFTRIAATGILRHREAAAQR